jgi:hypothetical protein
MFTSINIEIVQALLILVGAIAIALFIIWGVEFTVTRVFVALLPHTPRSFQRFVISIRICMEAINLWGYTSEANALNKEAAKKLARAERQALFAQQCSDTAYELIAERDALR